MTPTTDADFPFLHAEWPAPAGVRAGTTLRGHLDAGGAYAGLNLAAHVGDDPDRVARNRARLVTALGLPTEPAWIEQVHGTRVVNLDLPWSGSADGSCSTRPGVVAAVLTADCLPVLLCNRRGDWVAALHAGWRGLADGVLEAGVAAYAGSPADLLAWMGPAIGPAAFEIDAPVRDAFVQHHPEAASAFSATRPGHWLGDLYQLARQRLARTGVTEVYGGGRCSFSEADLFYSFRRDVATGRMASLVWREA